MQVRITKAGILSTVQDLGRHGYQSSGIPVSGAMDTAAASIANILLGNERNAAVLELTYGNVELISETEMLICCGGAGAELWIEGTKMSYWKPLFIPQGKQLVFKQSNSGCRTYLAVAGGWQSSVVLGSCSTYLPAHFGGFQGRALQPGDRLESARKISGTARTLLVALASSQINSPKWGAFVEDIVNYSSRTVRVLKAEEFAWFTEGSQSHFSELAFTATRNSDRMAIQFSGEPILAKDKRQLLSTSVSKGTIQVIPSGALIMLMADCQTTGGYPRIGKIISVDISLCAQLRPGDEIRFEIIDLHEAERLYLQRERDLSELELSVLTKLEKL